MKKYYLVLIILCIGSLRYGTYLYSGDMNAYYLIMFIIHVAAVFALLIFKDKMLPDKEEQAS